MLSEKQNRALTEVGAGTGMGELLRRYWMPIAAVAELDDRPTKPVRLMGEDLVLYKDKSGTYGLLDRHCAHRRADGRGRSEEHTSELQSPLHLVFPLLLVKKKKELNNERTPR